MEAPGPKHVQIRDEPDPAPARAAAAAAAAARGGGGSLRALRQLVELEDRRLKAAAFFLFWGCCMVIYGTVLNRSANPEHVLAGFVLFTVGSAIALLTVAGAGGGRAASRVEGFLRGFF